ncbi:lysophospholipase L1-like esterase [Microbacteriaceae bacterium SG_E_30_P1]|uniref:Lysophospholipase L1-like esterase n=1 Tax=Antiquaquibacter oligotrophicus TaxID=2880260 RepID=A0ABT6KMQ7_9MICO|nr:SGNH/GDSL hydrolase family protein [Antiquaquibacter oligotrophicus]MDH6181295.1 lysophospholipase L1-like esterase [Antiquaquibacter oligotrophicus]UDF13012.1 SGNH/GDSL hydrolase family protein [Antiquaquibacter oligotrophicus]
MESGWNRYVALGDSITEGLCDPIVGAGEPWLGWADRLAIILDGNARLSGSSSAFANLAVRGRRVRHVVEEQVPRAIELRADLVSILIGGNDLMGAHADPDSLATEVEKGVAALRAAGIDVLLATCFDPRFAFFLKPLRGRAAVYNANLWSIAREHKTFTLDLWGIRELQSPSMWSEDRVHLSSSGHRLLASRAAHSLGIAYYEVAAPPAAALPVAPPRADLSFAQWARQHALPWVARRVRGVSTGDGRSAKLPRLISVAARR